MYLNSRSTIFRAPLGARIQARREISSARIGQNFLMQTFSMQAQNRVPEDFFVSDIYTIPLFVSYKHIFQIEMIKSNTL